MKERRGRTFSFPHSSFSPFFPFYFFFLQVCSDYSWVFFFLQFVVFLDLCILFLPNFPRISLTSIYFPFLSRFFPLISPICSSTSVRRQKRRGKRGEKNRKEAALNWTPPRNNRPSGLKRDARSICSICSIHSARERREDYIVKFHESVFDPVFIDDNNIRSIRSFHGYII